MLKILLIVGSFVSAPLFCVLAKDPYTEDHFEDRQLYPLITRPIPEYGKSRADIGGRSYTGYGTPSGPPYYPAFDPLSVLASLAFLAFLLQSFASLFDRSRSIVPGTVAGRESPETPESLEITRRILRALEKYVSNDNNKSECFADSHEKSA